MKLGDVVCVVVDEDGKVLDACEWDEYPETLIGDEYNMKYCAGKFVPYKKARAVPVRLVPVEEKERGK